MEINVNKFRRSVQQLQEYLTSAQLTADENRVLQKFVELNNYQENDVVTLLKFLSGKLLDSQFTEHIAVAFEEFLLLILTENVRYDEEVTESNFQDYKRKCVALAKLVAISVDVKRYSTNYFRNKPAPFLSVEVLSNTVSKSKKLKKDATPQFDLLAVIKCCYQLLIADPTYFKELWNWSPFVEQNFNGAKTNDLKQLYCNHILAILTNMTAMQLHKLNENISAEIKLQFNTEQRSVQSLPKSTNVLDTNEQFLTLHFNSDLVTNIEGVLLPIFNKVNYKFYTETDGSYDKIVKVDSTKVNLRSIALGIASAKAICLSGPVGCGKTTLVEYLARKTGRICPKPKEIVQQQHFQAGSKENNLDNSNNKNKSNATAGIKRKSDLDVSNLVQALELNIAHTNGFLRIQLGDQTDSKMLLGQYRCTDVPGEFIWLPGVLTQAVMNGYWLLLEDLHSAPQDTFTILSSLLENNCLSVPGFRDSVKIEPGFQLFVTVRTNKSSSNTAQKSLYAMLEKYLYTINILPLSRNELCKVVSTNYSKLATVANRIVDVFLTFSSGDHTIADNLRQQESGDKADTTEKYLALPFDNASLAMLPNSGRLVSTRDLIKLCQRSDPMFSVTSTECAYFVFQNAVDVFCSYLPQGREKIKLITSIGAKLGIIQSRCEFLANEYKPEMQVDDERIKIGRAELYARAKPQIDDLHTFNGESHFEPQAFKRQKLSENTLKSVNSIVSVKSSSLFSFTRMASCILERIAVCVTHAEPVLLVGETGVGKTSSVQYLAERTQHKLVVVNMNNQSDISDLVGGFKPVDLTYVLAPLRTEFEMLFRNTFNQTKNETFLNKFSICYNQGNFTVIIKLMIKVVNSVFEKSNNNELRNNEMELLPRWQTLKMKLIKLNAQLSKSINISFAFIPGSLVNCIKNGDWLLLDEINLASAETLECLSTILEPDGSVVLLEKGDFTPVKRHPDFRIFACMNPNTDIGKKDLSVGIRNRFTEFFVDELTTDSDLNLLISDYLSSTGIQKRSVVSIVKLYKQLKQLSKLELNDGLGNRPVFSLRTLCRSLRICAKNLCGSIERNLYESFCMSFLTQLDPISHNIVLQLIKGALLSNAKAVLKQGIPKPGENYLNFEGYWIQQGPKILQECANYILTDSVKENLKDLARIISIGKLPVLLQGPTSAGKTSLIEYVAKRSGNHCLRINNHEHTDLQEYIGTYAADVTGKLSFKEGVLVQAMRNGYWIILDELNLASTDILEALNRVLDDNRELFIAETQTVVKAHANFMLFATQNPPGLYGGRKTLSRAFKNRFIELHFSEIPRNELEIILEKRCFIPASYAKKMVMCMSDLQKNRKTTSKNVFTLRDLFRWGNRYTYADKKLLEDIKYDWNQHLIEEGYLVLSAKVRTAIEIEIIEEALYRNFRKRINLQSLFDAQQQETTSLVTRDIISSICTFKQRADIVWTRNMTRMAVLTAKALQFDEPVLLVGPTGCGKTTVCQILSSIHGVKLRILNCHMHTEGADFLGGLRPCRNKSDDNKSKSGANKLFEWADGPLIHAMQEGSYFMADEISLAEDSVLERLNCILEPERTVLLAEKGGAADGGGTEKISNDFIVHAASGFQFLATMNPGGDFGKKELSPALRNRFTEIWCLPSDSKEDLIQIAFNCIVENLSITEPKQDTLNIARYLVEVVLYIRDVVEKFKFSVRDILAWANYIVRNSSLSFPEKAIFGLETIFLDALEMLPHESLEKVELLKANILDFATKEAEVILNEKFTLAEVQLKRGKKVQLQENDEFGISPFFIPRNSSLASTVSVSASDNFLFDVPTTKRNLFRLLSALSLNKPVLLEGPPGVGKTSIVESIARAIGYSIVRINLCEHTDLADLFGTDLPAEDNLLAAAVNNEVDGEKTSVGSFVWRDGPLLAALKAANTWILLDELNLAPQSVLEGLNAILDHRGEVYIPELNKTFQLSRHTRIFACQNPLKQGGGRKGLPQSFLNRFNKVYLRKLTTDDLLFVVNGKYSKYFEELRMRFVGLLEGCNRTNGNIFDILKNSQIIKLDEPKLQSADLGFDLANRLVKFSETLDRGIAAMEFGYKGGPYEINLRDILRWCDLLINPETGFIFKLNAPSKTNPLQPFQQNFKSFLLTLYERMKLVYYQRMRSDHDKVFIRNAFAHVFNCDAEHLNALSEDVALYWTEDKIFFNDIVLKRESGMQALYMLKSKELSPLLLSSQREILKNVIECVHMEKPVLICGSTDTGKTKVIDAVCTLSNQVCNTDTIDDSVTGSFQQIDLNRHLEEISQNIEAIFMTYLQQTVLEKSGSCKTIAELLSSWSDYNMLTKTKPVLNNNTAMSEELLVFRNRIQKLNKVIEQLLNSSPIIDASSPPAPQFQAALTHQQDLLGVLQNHIRNADSLNTGGSFEWVDSKIVKTLKCGQYILLEHVNLCSSAVLDRLNPIFEPNGNLLISEKGVSANDTAEVVEKSPNFRAFLTIDPKNGELSRAMRNRCVEISMTKDNYHVDDVRMIVHSNGVRDCSAINCILTIHDRIVNLTEINNYSISHLTQFAFLTASYKHIGYAMQRAIYVSGMEVYVYSANIDLLGYGLAYYQNKLRDIVLEETNKFEINVKGIEAGDHLANVILNCRDLNETTMIKLQMEPLNLLLLEDDENGISSQQALCALFNDFTKINFARVERKQLIKYFIYMLYESSSMDDVNLRYLYLQQLLQSQHPQLAQLSSNFYACVQHFQDQCSEPLLSQLPWNYKLYPRIRDYAAQLISATNHKAYCLSSLLILRLLLEEIPQVHVEKLHQITALTYSQAVATKSLTDKLNNAFLHHFSTFLAALQSVLKDALKYARFDMHRFTQMITSYLWFNRLLALSQKKLFINKQLDTDLMDKLLLHFKWLDKNLLQPLETILPNYRQLNTEFESSLLKLTNYMLSIKPPLNLIRKVYAKQMIQFQPFYQQEQIKFYNVTHRMDHLLNPLPFYGSFTPEYVLKKFMAQKLDATKKSRALLNKQIEQQFDYNFRETHFNTLKDAQISHIPEQLKIALHKFMTEIKEQENQAMTAPIDFDTIETNVVTIQEFINSQEELTDSAKPKDIELGMLPLREYYLTKALVQIIRVESKSVTERAQLNEVYCDEIPSLNNETWHLIKLIATRKYNSFLQVWSQLVQHIDALQEDTNEFEILFGYLNGGYKNLTVFYRLILNASLKQQLTNLAVRSSCTRMLKSIEDIDCHYAYEGPSLINSLIALIFRNDGSLKPVPLQDLDLWKKSLHEMRQLLWHNAVLMTPSYSILQNNLRTAQQNAKRLLHEVAYVQKLCEDMENENFSDYNEGFQKLVQSLTACENEKIETRTHLKQQHSAQINCQHSAFYYQQMQYNYALLNALVGSIEMCLLTFTPLIDPVEKHRLKSAYLIEDINCLTTMTTVYDFMKIIMKYKHFGFEICESFEEYLKVLHIKQQKFSQKLALRPEKCLYSSLVQDITHFLKSNCEPQVLHKLILDAQVTWTALTVEFEPANAAQTLEQCTETLSKINLWIANSQRFVNHILKPYKDYYQDFLQPLQCSIDQLRFGLENFKVVLTQVSSAFVHHSSANLHININKNDNLHNILSNIIEFPAVQSLNIFNVSASRDILKNRSPIFSILDKIPNSEHDYFRLLKAKLVELQNRIAISASVEEETFRSYDFALNVCNQIWQQEEDRRRRQKAEDESLYIQKTKCETEDEELVELQEIEEMFPTNVQEDFGEFIVEDTLEKIMKLDRKNDFKLKQAAQVINDEDCTFLAEHFINVMTQYSRVYYHNSSIATTTKQQKQQHKQQQQQQLEFITPFKERMKVFCKIFTLYKTSLNECLDAMTYNSFSFVISLQQQLLNEISFSSDKYVDLYNFYKDSNIPEVISCTDVLNRIEVRVLEQLDLYPEHASLIDIKNVIARIRTLPSISPVVRFNTGFQILRQKMSQWNEVAHKQNHLRNEEMEVAEYVQKWTKLELQFWRNCLTQTYEKVKSSAYKYWFFIYNLIEEYILDHELDNSYTEMKYTEKRFAEGEVLDAVEVEKKSKVTATDIVRILRQFVEASSYGDFHVRIRLLQAFEMYLHNVYNNSSVDTLANVKKCELIAGLRNLQIYFDQFSREIEEAKQSIRAPIEKKLKEFVKIESYNKDLSYFSMRNNVARVHRNLNKFLKEYQLQLQQKITPVFQPKDATVKDYNFENDKGRDLRYDTKIKYYMVDVKLFVAPLQKLQENVSGLIEEESSAESAQTLLQRVRALFKISRNVVKETVSNAGFPKLIIALDVLLCTQMERCENLRSLTVNRTKERAKQVLEAKQILQQKRKGLTDLFKTLAQLGCSYKSGLMELSLRSDFEDFSLPPFCIKTMLGAFKDMRMHARILHLNENLDKYYAKCVFKLKLLQNIMLTPLSELGPPNIERIKGFAVDMFLLVQQQRQLLANTTKNIFDLRVMIQGLKEIADISTKEIVPDVHLEFSRTRNTYLSLKHSICHIRCIFEQFTLLLNCAPDVQHQENKVLATAECILLRNSTYFGTLTKLCDNVIQLAQNTISDMLQNDTEFMNFEKICSYEARHEQLIALIKQIKEFFKTTPTSTEYLPIATPLIELLFSIEKTTYKKGNDAETQAETFQLNFENIDAELENVLHNMLLALQKLYKKYPKPNANNSSDETSSSPKRKQKEEEDETEVHEHHLKQKLHGELVADWQIMNLPNIIEKLSNILLTLKHSPGSPLKLNYARKISSILPILVQYHFMAEYYLFQQLGAHKVCAKMLSVMLTVFVEISTNGFCVPADLMQDEEGQAKKDQKEGEGFGLEDGTGEKDASDKIESEDQLDDAKRPEDRKDEDDKKQDDCKEEKGIEMSDDFDAKMQDIDKPENEEDDSAESEEDEGDLNKEMGETEEGAEKLDDQIWGDDEEPEQEDEEEKDMNEDDGKGNKDEKDAHNDLDTKNDAARKDDGKDEHDKDGLDATNEPNGEDKRKEKENDIDKMKDPELDEDQANPYHNELEEPPQPEEMDLGNMNNDLDDEHENGDEQQDDENPFDIDAMKENMSAAEEKDDEEKTDEDENDGNATEADDSDSDEEGTELKQDKNEVEETDAENEKHEDEDSETQKRGEQEPDESEKQKEAEEENREEKPEEHAQSKDKSSKEENVQSVPETENKASSDQVQKEEEKEDVKQQQKMDEQETGEEKEGVGQAENETDEGGHQGIAETKETITQEERKNERKTEEKRRQGRTNEERTLGEAEKNKIKQLKTIDKLKQQNESNKIDADEPDEQELPEADEYQHVKDPKNNDKTTLDNATEEQSKQIKHNDEETQDEEDQKGETNEDELMEMDDPTTEHKIDDENLEEMSAEKFDQKSDKPSKSEKNNERAEAQEEMEVEGDIVPTMTVPRSEDTTAHCIKEILLDTTMQAQELSTAETIELRKLYQQQLFTNKASLPQHEDYELWQTISNRMVQNARDLCEQLRLILEPTKCTRLKGDYRTGRRINMKKIIPYIASQFRKDKIWLRRTKPAQRDYKITIAIDDSKSMHHNNSKTLTLEAISLVSQALNLLESGRLSIVSFGESPQIVLNHTEQFDGPKLVNSLNFEQDKTKVAELLDFVRTVNTEEGALGSDNGLFENLLLVLSDGRNIYSEGKAKVKNAIKLARLQRIFLVYVIIDNPENKNSILDIQAMEMLSDKSINIKSYLDDFPFPYYVIVRDLNQLPLVLSEAMRQWFELVNSEQ